MSLRQEVCEIQELLDSLPTIEPVDIYSEEYAGGPTWSRNSTVTQTGVGEWLVTLLPSHPDGEDYHVSLSNITEETRPPQVYVQEGSKTASSFVVRSSQLGQGAGNAFNAVDTNWTFGVDAPVTVAKII